MIHEHGPRLDVLEVGAQALLLPGDEVPTEVHCRDQHEHDQHGLDRRRVEMADARVVGREATERQRGEGVADRIEPAHADQLQGQDAGHRDQEVHEPEALAVCAMRGVSLSFFIGPGVSARYICMPPTPSSGRIATTSTMMPMPPYQWSA